MIINISINKSQLYVYILGDYVKLNDGITYVDKSYPDTIFLHTERLHTYHHGDKYAHVIFGLDHR